MITESVFGISALVGLGSSLGSVGVSGLYKAHPNLEFELGIGHSIVTDTNIAANAYFVGNVSERTRHLVGVGYNLSLNQNGGAIWGGVIDFPRPQGDSANTAAHEPGTYKGHWLNTCWGVEFGTKFTFGFLIGLSLGYVETTKGGEVYQKDDKYYRRKNDYSSQGMILTLVPARFTYPL